MESAEGYYADARYKQAANLLKQCKYEEAIEFFGELLQACEAKHGDLALETAPAYYEYGNALFARVEETTDLLGDALKAAQERARANAEEVEKADGDANEAGDDEADDEEDVNDDEANGEAEEDDADTATRPSTTTASEGASAPTDESDEDKQLAWEVLEVAKKIYQENSSAETDLPLSNVFSRLADISRFDGHYQDAIRDYTECLHLRQAALPATSRDLADVLYNMGVCHVYRSNEEDAMKHAELREAISKYSQARDILKKRSEEESTPESEKADLRSIVEDLGEEVDALQQELQQDGASSSSAAQLPTTTIGFGNPSASNGVAAAPATVATAAASNDAAPSTDTSGVMMLQGRSKKKRPEGSKAPTSNENEDPEAKRVRSD